MFDHKKLRRRLVYLVWGSVLVLAALFVVRIWVGDVYTVVSASMEPTLRKGDRVWVGHGKGVPNRYDLFAFRNEAGQLVVKRLVGLPEEEVMLDFFGDLWINNERPERTDLWVPIFDDRVMRVSDHFLHGGQSVDPWVERSGFWEVDARSIPTGHYQGMLRHRDGVDNGQLLPDGSYQRGLEAVGDVRLRFDVWIVDSGGILKLELVEQSDTFQVLFDLDNLERGRMVLLQLNGSQGPRGEQGIYPLTTQTWIPMTLQNRDNRVELYVRDQLVAAIPDAENTQNPLGSIGERVLLGGTGSHLRFRSIRIDRDVTYTSRGEHAVGNRLTLGPDQFFFLGDNSHHSEDSRSLGPISRDQLLGRVSYRLWPWGQRGGL